MVPNFVSDPVGLQPTDLIRGGGQDPRPPWIPAFAGMTRWVGRGAKQRYMLIGAAAGLLLVAICFGGPAAARVPEILVFGDSLTAGLGLPAEAAFPSRLEARLKGEGVGLHIVNAGVS